MEPASAGGWHGEVVTADGDQAMEQLDDLRWLAEVEERMPADARGVPFSALWWPHVEQEWARLAADHPALTATLTSGAKDGLLVALVVRLAEVSGRVLLDLMTADLTVGQRLLRRVLDPPENPPRARFARFCRALSGPAKLASAISADHPVLPDLVSVTLRQWRAATIEMLTRVARQRTELHERFGIDPTSPVTGVALSAGDRHHDGRSVAVLAFGDARLVYKPRDVRLEALWREVLEVVFGQRVRAPGTLAADDGQQYGFTEFIGRTPMPTGARRATFYRNAGRTLAVLYALGGTDCHHENLIVAGDQLVLVDAESLFETRGAGLVADLDGQAFTSVMDVGMLPQWVWLAGEGTAIDLSALGATAASRSVVSAGWRAVNTDAMSRGVIEASRPAAPSPSAAGDDLAGHVADLVTGFADGYRALVDSRREVIAVLARSRELSRRLILRPTYVYAAVLKGSWHPSALRGQEARDDVLGQIGRAYVGADPSVRVLLEAELAALANLDVPMFTATLTGERTAWPGGQLLGWPGVDAIADVEARLGAFGDADLRWQARVIRSAVAARQFTGGGGAQADVEDASVVTGVVGAGSGEESGDPARGAAPRAVAVRAHRRILDDALWAGAHVTWLTVALLPDGQHANVQRLGSGLYDGALGIGLYLHVSGDPDAAHAALAPLLAELDSGDPARLRRQVTMLGPGFSGVGGQLRALRWLARRGFVDTDLVDRGVAAAVAAVPLSMVAEDRWLDVMSGAAGLVVPLAAELARVPRGDARNHLLSLLAAAADRLTAAQRPDGGWDTLPASAPLTGYAHGASGIAVALATAHRVLGDDRYLDAALRGLDYEASTFDASTGNWPDYRQGARSGFMLGWCAGAPGIGLARLRLLELLPDHPAASGWRADLAAAAHATAAAPLLDRDHVCCGNLGRSAILDAVGRALGQDRWVRAARSLTEAVARRCGGDLPRSFLGVTPSDVLAVPGLMTGLAGAGLVLGANDGRREATSEWVPALLL